MHEDVYIDRQGYPCGLLLLPGKRSDILKVAQILSMSLIFSSTTN